MDEAAQVRTAGRPLLPRRIHAAGADCRHRLPEQGRRLRSLVQGFLADNAHDCGRSQAPGRQDRLHLGARRLRFFGDHAHLAGKAAFKAYLAPLHRTKWFVYSKRPFAGPEQVLAYLSRYTHRVAISNSRLIAADATGVTFRYKDYRIEGPGRYKTMTLKPDEFIR